MELVNRFLGWIGWKIISTRRTKKERVDFKLIPNPRYLYDDKTGKFKVIPVEDEKKPKKKTAFSNAVRLSKQKNR